MGKFCRDVSRHDAKSSRRQLAAAASAAAAVPTMQAALKVYRLAVMPWLKGADTYAYWLDEFERAPMAAKPINQVTPFDLSGWRNAAGASAQTRHQILLPCLPR